MDEHAINAVFPALQDRMADELTAAYQFPGQGSGYFSPVPAAANLLLVVRRQACIHDLRETYVKHVQSAPTGDAPSLWVSTEAAIRRYLQLNPLFARHLARNGRRLSGAALPAPAAAAIHPAEQTAFLAHRALVASAALAPARLPEQRQAQAAALLGKLAVVLIGPEAVQDATAAEQFALIQERLQQRIQELALHRRQTPPIQDTGQPNLDAMYEDGEFLLVIIPPIAARLLRRLDWNSVLQQAPERLMALAVGTAGQLRLAVQAERPMDYLLGSFRHLWGRNRLASLEVSRRAVFRQAARKPAELLHTLSADYVQAADKEAVHRVIHDYQNQLLNMRLEHELLHRTQGLERTGPDEELPRRNEPNDVRIDAIITHLEWWAAYYAEKMTAAPTGEKMAPNEH